MRKASFSLFLWWLNLVIRDENKAPWLLGVNSARPSRQVVSNTWACPSHLIHVLQLQLPHSVCILCILDDFNRLSIVHLHVCLGLPGLLLPSGAPPRPTSVGVPPRLCKWRTYISFHSAHLTLPFSARVELSPLQTHYTIATNINEKLLLVVCASCQFQEPWKDKPKNIQDWPEGEISGSFEILIYS